MTIRWTYGIGLWLGVAMLAGVSFLYWNTTRWYAIDQAHEQVELKNRIAWSVIVSNVDDAIHYLHDAWLTRFATRESFMASQTLRRDEAAAFFVRFARDVLWTEQASDYHIDIDMDGYWWPAHCEFQDLDEAHNDLVDEIRASCRLGLFQWHAWRFMPQDEFTNAHALTVMMRMLEGRQEEPEDDWARNYFLRAQRAWLVVSLDAEDVTNLYRPITRWDVAKMIEGSAVFVASTDQLRCWVSDYIIDPLDPDDDGDSIPTHDERCVVEWPLRRLKAQDYSSTRSNKAGWVAVVCTPTDTNDCDDTDPDVRPDDMQSVEGDQQTDIHHKDTDKATVLHDMPCDWVRCPDWSCAATRDECGMVEADAQTIFVTASWDDFMWCWGAWWRKAQCPRERQTSLTVENAKAISDDHAAELAEEFITRAQLRAAKRDHFVFSHAHLKDHDNDLHIVLVEPSSQAISPDIYADHQEDDRLQACITPWGWACPKTKTCEDWTVLPCTCNTGYCLCKMCSLEATIEKKPE